MKQAAGLLLYRRKADVLEVLLVHPSGNYNRKAPWSLPKGLPDEGESLLDAAVRETREEAGVSADAHRDALVPLGHIDYTRSRKRVHAFALEAPADVNPHAASWEIDRVEFFSLEKARGLIHIDQRPFLDRLQELLAEGPKPAA
jgi:predicted NUDIX family NTP pyrophosphohydrolase